MESSYLEGELTPQEISYLLKIIVNAKKDYIRKYNRGEGEYIELEKVDIVDKDTSQEMAFKDVDLLLKKENLRYILSDVILSKSLEILTEKERLVFFSFYCLEKTTIEIADELELDRSRISHIKKEARDKVFKKYQELKGISENG